MTGQTGESTRTRMTAAEFLALPESNQITELLDGEVTVTPAPSVEHQDAVLSIALFLKLTVTDGKVNIAPNDVYLDEENVVQPDVFWAGSAGSRCRIGEDRRWHGAPDLVVEVSSPSTFASDRGHKYDLYEQHGVREYWIVEPQARAVEVYVLQEGRFARRGLYQPGERFESAVLSAQVDVSKVFGG